MLSAQPCSFFICTHINLAASPSPIFLCPPGCPRFYWRPDQTGVSAFRHPTLVMWCGKTSPSRFSRCGGRLDCTIFTLHYNACVGLTIFFKSCEYSSFHRFRPRAWIFKNHGGCLCLAGAFTTGGRVRVRTVDGRWGLANAGVLLTVYCCPLVQLSLIHI